MSLYSFASVRSRVLGAVVLLVVLAMSLSFAGAFDGNAIVATAAGTAAPDASISGRLSSNVVQTPEAARSSIEGILGRARRFAVFHGIEPGHPSQTWKFEKAYLWGDIGIGPGVRTDFGNESTLIGDCYEHPGQAAGKGCVSIKPHSSAPPHVAPAYVDYTRDLTLFVQDVRAAVTYVDALPATQTLERIAGGATIVSPACGTLNVIRVNREVNVGGKDHGMTIQGCATDVFIFDVGGQWASSGGQVRLSGGVPASNILWVFKGRLQNSGNGGWAGTAIFDTPDGADNAGKDLSCTDCALLVLNGKLNTSAGSNLRWHPFTVFDYGDAPKRYGTLFSAQSGVARHKFTQSGPRLSLAWTGETDGQPTLGADADSGEDGVTALPLIQAFYPDPVVLTVSATNPGSVPATVACWIDFNRDDDFADPGERAQAAVAISPTPIPVTLTFDGFRDPVPGPTYLRCRISATADAVQSPVTTPPAAAPSPLPTTPMFPLDKATYLANDSWPNGEVEDYRVVIEWGGDPGQDYGDAPDTGVGTGQGNYNTLRTDYGPTHLILDDLSLGVNGPDLEFGTLQNSDATADDLNVSDDEDGIPALPAISTQSQLVQMGVVASNNTANDASLRCWIDFNRNGSFGESGEGSSFASVGANSGTATYTVVFGGFAAPTAGVSYIRCRIVHAPADFAQPVAYSGEVEDFRVVINQ